MLSLLSHIHQTRLHQLRFTGLLLGSLGILCLGCSSQEDPQVGAVENALLSADTTATQNPDQPNGDLLFPKVDIATSLGHIVVKLNAQSAPSTVHNFLDYVNQGFYSDTLVHYVSPGKMILGGGYTLSNEPKPTRPSIRNEAHNGLKNVRGTVTMTRNPDEIDSATSQFFINLADAPNFDHVEDNPDEYGYCVFGEVIEGLEIADNISQVETTDRGDDLSQTPAQPVVIQSVTVLPN